MIKKAGQKAFKRSFLGPIPEGWEVVRLGEITSLIRNGLVYKETQTKSSKDTFPITRIETISDGAINPQKIGQVSGLSDSDIEKWRLRPGDILFSHINSLEHIGKVAIYEGEPEILIHGMNLLCIRPKENRISPYFLFYWFIFARSCGVFKNMSKKAVNQASINQSEMKRLKFPLPPLPEQRRIAGVLRTVDEAIEKVDEEIEHTERLKRGLMQHLLTRGIGHARFKDTPIGKIPEKWEVVRLGEVFKIFAGGDVSKLRVSKKRTSKFRYPIYSNSIESDGLYGFSDTYQFSENSITVTARGTLGRAIPRYEKFCAIIRLIVMIPISLEKVDIVFVSNYINSRISLVVEKTSIPQLTVPRISKWLIPLPPLPEQKRIAEILMTVDRKLELLRQKRDHMERLKKGLMNDLLTGRRRLRVSNAL